MNKRSLSPQEEITQLRKKARRRLVGAIAIVFIAVGILWNIVGKTPQKSETESIAIVQDSGSTSVVSDSSNHTPLRILDTRPQPTASEPTPTPSVATAQPDITNTTTISATIPSSPSLPADPIVMAEQSKLKMEKEKKRQEDKRLAEEKRKKEKEARQQKEAETARRIKPADPAAILEGRDIDIQPKTAAPQSSDTEKVIIQLAALSDEEKISALKNKLKEAGIQASYSKTKTSKGEITRVRVGPFNSRIEAEAAQRRLSSAGLSGIIIPQ